MPSDAESAVQVDAWARVLSSSLVLAVAAPLTILTCWGAFGLGIAPAIVGVIAIVAALLVCCCQKAGCSRTCADPCCCRLCPDCADFIGAWHLRNVLFVIAVLSPIFCLPTFIAGVVFTALPTDCSVDCQPRNDLTIDDCRRCWNLDWARHEYPWSLMDQCWSAQVDVWRRGHEPSPAIRKDYERWRNFHCGGELGLDRCKELCSCVGGRAEVHCFHPSIFGIPALLSSAAALCLLGAGVRGLFAANAMIKELGGPRGRVAYAMPHVVSVGAQPTLVGQPFAVAGQHVAVGTPC
eukprot:gnl/TRDRNA2_/TRDRNA2_28492_c0_seq1.p1 gnl/TRDRNA2_/TRDRNA2_28492_c0~~gnl/TRDRNA2_/TRDRNA2_28492_c0_seq1.p1  ORF type:complete len:294 (-),score=19.97 gnl/TRDRNA2_/TRDRNA2_28492_c0_seq1:14-895(-)